MKKEKQYVILGDNNFWYATIIGTEENAVKILRKHTRKMLEKDYEAETVPLVLWLMEVKDIAKRYIK